MTADLSQQAEALMALSERATAGRWRAEGANAYDEPYVQAEHRLVAVCPHECVDEAGAKANAAFIAAARTTAPALAAAYLAMRWRTMDSAPKDRWILVCDRQEPDWAGNMWVVKWFGDDEFACWWTSGGPNGGIDYESDAFTHWMPLPTPPTKETDDVSR